jgi:DNA-binding beta-propeller fold protein YncE
VIRFVFDPLSGEGKEPVMASRIAALKAAVAAVAAGFLIGSAPSLSVAAEGFDSGYHLIKKLPLGGEGRWDYLTIESAARRLYISRSSYVMVVDLDTEKVVGDIPDTSGVHGIAIAPELNRGFTSNGGSGTSTIFDLKTLQVIGSVKTGANPDCIIYDPASKRVFTFNGRSEDATAFDAASGEVVGTIPLGGRPEYAAADGRGKVYGNIESTSEVVEIDSAKLVVTKRFPLAPGEEPSGLAVDPARHLVFSGCHNRMMTVLDVASGKVVATVPIGRGVDANAFDPGTGLAFSSNGDGTLTVARETPGTPGTFEADSVQTQQGARTMALDLKTHNVYLVTAQFEPAPAREGAPAEGEKGRGGRGRQTMVKDSFTVLIVGK